MSIPSSGIPLHAVIEKQIKGVRTRVENGGGDYGNEITEVELAASRIDELKAELKLGDFITSLTPDTGKPQFLLVFDRGEFKSPHSQVILKVYGRSSPGEGLLQTAWTKLDKAVVPTHAYGDEPTSWLVMDVVPNIGLGTDLKNHPDRLLSRTRELAAVMEDLSTSVSPKFPGAQSLHDGIFRHLKNVVNSLDKHGYEVPQGWEDHAAATYNSGRTLPLHGDLFPGNALITADKNDNPGRLLVLDCAADSCVGAPEFDGARWVARVGTPDTFDELAAAWKEGAPSTNRSVFAGMLALETLMQAGVTEIIKDEKGLPWSDRDPATEALLGYYNAQRELQLDSKGLDRGL